MKSPVKNNPFKFNTYWMYAIIIIFLIGIYYFDDTSITKEVRYDQFKTYVEQRGVRSIVVYRNKDLAEAVITDSLASAIYGPQFRPESGSVAKISTKFPSVDKFSEAADQWDANGLVKDGIKYEESADYSGMLWSILPFVFIIAFWMYMMRRMSGKGGGPGGPGGIFSVGKSKAKVYEKGEGSQVTFADVAGLSEAKTEVAELVEFLKNPKRYTDLGGKIPKGALLVGPPGTGKTLLAKAVAGEASVPFFSLSGSDFVEMFVGVGPSRVRDLFAQAKEKAPCIIFIDEIDAVGRARGKNPNFGANDERENTLNQLLTEMDGFGTNSGVIVLAATNRADILDKALLRAGRFDRQIYVDLPELMDRVAIFNVHLKKIKTAPGLDVDLLARQTPGFSGADIANVCNEAALIAARNNKTEVTRDDFLAAVDRIIGGLEKSSKIITADEKRSIAIHEAGHATVSWHLQYANPLVKVTIVPRGKALGAAWYLPEERQITPRQALLDQICSLLAGRAAEELFTGTISTGAANDLERVTQMAQAMVLYYGMSEKLPNLSYYDSTGQQSSFTKPYSEDRSRVIDEEISAIISAQYQRAKDILTLHAKGHNQLAELLIAREVILSEDVVNIFGPRQWTSRTDEIIAATPKNDKNDVKIDNDDDPIEDVEAEDVENTSATPPPYNPRS